MELYKERIEEYEREIEIIDIGLKAYDGYGHPYKPDGSIEYFQKIERENKLRLEKKQKTAAIAQLKEKINESERIFKIELQQMKDNFKSILKKASGLELKKDTKRLVLGIKNKELAKNWISDKHKLQAYKMLLNIVNENSNGNAI